MNSDHPREDDIITVFRIAKFGTWVTADDYML